MITKQEIDNMTPEELEAFKRQASVAIVKRMGMMFLFKLGMHLAIRQLAKKFRENTE